MNQEHEWVVVLNRRWCLTCGAFQKRRDLNRGWQPVVAEACPWNTEYADNKQRASDEQRA